MAEGKRKASTPQCPVHNVSAITAYAKPRRCRCEVCSAFNKERLRLGHLRSKERGRRSADEAYRERRTTPECPVTGLSASSAYNVKKCRCDTCREWKSGAHKKHREENKDEIKRRDRERYAADPEKVLRRNRAWKVANPEKVRAGHVKKKARKRDATPDFAKGQALDRIYAAALYAGELLGGEYHVDHVKPLSRGGLHRWGNLQILSAQQNMSKHNKLESELDWTPEPVPLALLLWILDNGTTDHEGD